MKNHLLDLSHKLIQIPSTKENINALNSVLNIVKNELKEFKHEYFKKNNIPSFLFYNSTTRPQRFKIILNAHLDVVPALKEQYAPFEKEGKLYGRGAVDMKAAAAVEILAFKDVAKKVNYPLGLQLVTDEEIGGFDGTKYQIEKGVKADFVITGEPTNFGVNNKAKGIIWVLVTTKGISAHGAYPWQGKNAIYQMGEFLNELKKIYPVPEKEVWKTTVNVAKIETTNQTFNKVPDNCIVSLDIRYIPEDSKKILKDIKKILPNDAILTIKLNEPAQFTDEKNPYVLKLRKTTEKILRSQSKIIVKHGGSDIRHYNQVGCDGVTFGPIGEGLHTDNEWVDIQSLESYHLILKEFLSSIS